MSTPSFFTVTIVQGIISQIWYHRHSNQPTLNVKSSGPIYITGMKNAVRAKYEQETLRQDWELQHQKLWCANRHNL